MSYTLRARRTLSMDEDSLPGKPKTRYLINFIRGVLIMPENDPYRIACATA